MAGNTVISGIRCDATSMISASNPCKNKETSQPLPRHPKKRTNKQYDCQKKKKDVTEIAFGRENRQSSSLGESFA
jgi:hypothetical protein